MRKIPVLAMSIRPVGVALDRNGALLVANDVGNAIWRVTPSSKSAAR